MIHYDQIINSCSRYSHCLMKKSLIGYVLKIPNKIEHEKYNKRRSFKIDYVQPFFFSYEQWSSSKFQYLQPGEKLENKEQRKEDVK